MRAPATTKRLRLGRNDIPTPLNLPKVAKIVIVRSSKCNPGAGADDGRPAILIVPNSVSNQAVQASFHRADCTVLFVQALDRIRDRQAEGRGRAGLQRCVDCVRGASGRGRHGAGTGERARFRRRDRRHRVADSGRWIYVYRLFLRLRYTRPPSPTHRGSSSRRRFRRTPTTFPPTRPYAYVPQFYGTTCPIWRCSFRDGTPVPVAAGQSVTGIQFHAPHRRVGCRTTPRCRHGRSSSDRYQRRCATLR